MKKEQAQSTQMRFCQEKGIPFVACDPHAKVGIALNVKSGVMPINGLRCKLEGGTTGWYIWAGEDLSEEPDFFKPLHTDHLDEWCPQIIKYLGMAPGWRFLISDGYEDVWFDSALLQENTD